MHSPAHTDKYTQTHTELLESRGGGEVGWGTENPCNSIDIWGLNPMIKPWVAVCLQVAATHLTLP